MRRSATGGSHVAVIASAGDTVPRERVAGNREGGGWREEGTREGRLTWAGGCRRADRRESEKGTASTEKARRGNERERESWLGVTIAISWARGRYCTEREWRSVKGRSRGVAGNGMIGKYRGGREAGSGVVR